MSETPRLSRDTLAQRTPGVAAPAYQLEGRTPGIVHFGPGAFHRAHQAASADAELDSDPRWSISEVALNSTGTADALQPQDGLYVLALLSEAPEYRIIGSIAELLTAREHGEAILQRLAAPTTQLVTSTVTEKGYCLSPEGGLDRAAWQALVDGQLATLRDRLGLPPEPGAAEEDAMGFARIWRFRPDGAEVALSARWMRRSGAGFTRLHWLAAGATGVIEG